MSIIRTNADITALREAGVLTEGDEKLLAACRAGEECRLGTDLPPEDAGPDRQVSAEVLRYLILGGCNDHPVEGRGVQLAGALVIGQLDLSFQMAKGATGLINCRFTHRIEALESRLSFLNLNGCGFPGLNAQGAEVKGGVFLSNVTTTGEVSLSGAMIGGQLVCNGVTLDGGGAMALDGGEARALNAQGAEVKGGVFLKGTTTMGEVSLSGAVIGGQLACTGATLDGNGARALNAQDAKVKGGLLWRDDVEVTSGDVSLAAAHLAVLADDPARWPSKGNFNLDGLTYERIYGDLDVATRLRWLEVGSYPNGIFRPQPYTQLAKVYRELGRDGESRTVLRDRERRERVDLRRRRRVAPDGSVGGGFLSLWSDVANSGRWLLDIGLRAFVGYGYAPRRSVAWLLAIWLIATALAHLAWEAGDFAPNSDIIQVSDAWVALSDDPNPAAAWSDRQGRDWETFNRYIYAADLVIPIIDLDQTDAWTASTSRGDWGRRLWRYGPLLNITGWLITALGAAAITGVIRRD